MHMSLKSEYLCCHDYGQGGVWIWVIAESPQQIRDRFPNVTVYEPVPDWWNERGFSVREKQDIDQPLSALSRLILVGALSGE